ncbi:membrane protein [Gordoniibacillus kamchatkensis]|uniref:Membrane protein n=2 Tax=Gordoniibacillus kamchatkensis TaxID=1590651 RepID=A0ABR5AIE9_9BACL|nr:spore germination protein [Paenibacillus sp. VKM B-2647]KIL40830.1 membrane protein [Paenibacillus sp. VKM B-2647]
MQQGAQAPSGQDFLAPDLQTNEQVLRSQYANCADVVFRDIAIAGSTKALLLYIEGLSNTVEIDQSVLAMLMEKGLVSSDVKTLLQQKVAVSNIKEVTTFTETIQHVSVGNPILLIDGQNRGLALGLSKWEKRSIEEPTAEAVIRGPREGFTESIGVNTSLLRRKIRSPKLKMQSMTVGTYTQTRIMIAYIEGLADDTVLQEVMNRLERIDIDGVLESGYIEEMIEDYPFSPFPQILNTERPDVAASGLLEGRVVILVDGTPFALVAPVTLYSMLQSAEDYYQRFLIGSTIRWLRYLFFLIALLMPSIYVAILTFHQEMIPTTLLLSIAKSREEIPFPALVEAILMEVSFEALREAGVRLPKQVGAAVSIVGALVIGEAATSAGLVSAPMVMVVALTGIASFTIPRYATGIAIRMIRFPVMFLAGTLGLLGIMLGLIVIIIHLCTIRSFGVPYLSPMGPMKARDMKDVLLRAPWWSLNTRPHLIGDNNPYRQSRGNKPDSNKGSE